MTLNTGPLLCGKLPSDLFVAYVGYKKATRTITAWLSSSLHRHGAPSSIIDTIPAMRAAAESVRRQLVDVPLEIKIAFEETIKARAQLTRFFRKSQGGGVDTASNASHEFFTNSLKQIYAVLGGNIDKPKRVSGSFEHEGSTEPRFHAVANRFDVLSKGGMKKEDERVSGHTSNKVRDPEECCTKVEPEKISEENHLPLADDDLSTAMEILGALDELQTIYATVNKSWEDAAARSTSIVLAAFTTNAAFKTIETIETRIRSVIGSSDPQALFRKYKELQPVSTGHLQGPEHRVATASCRSSSVIDELLEPWAALSAFGALPAEGRIVKPKFQKITDYVCPHEADCGGKERVCFAALLDNMTYIINRNGERPSTVARQGTPLYKDISLFSPGQADVSGIRCAFGLRMLLSTCQCHTWPMEKTPTSTNCRVEALRFAEEALVSIRAVLDDQSMPCRCCRTLAYHLELLKHDLQSFMTERVFDLFSQTPWVAGSQMLEILEATFYYGLKLTSYRHYVGSILHTYNVLTKIGGMRPVPLLERLTTVLQDVVFCGSRPSQNFNSCFVRFMGGRIRFHTRAGPHHRKDHQYNWNLQLPRRRDSCDTGLRTELNDTRFTYEKVSLLHHIKAHKYVLCEPLWRQVRKRVDIDEEEEMQNPGNRRRTSSACPSTASRRLEGMHEGAMSEFQGDFPVAKINFFAVYLLCVRIIAAINGKTHDKDDSLCLCFAYNTLQAADAYKAHARAPKRFREHALSETCREAIEEALKDKCLSDFLWNI